MATGGLGGWRLICDNLYIHKYANSTPAVQHCTCYGKKTTQYYYVLNLWILFCHVLQVFLMSIPREARLQEPLCIVHCIYQYWWHKRSQCLIGLHVWHEWRQQPPPPPPTPPILSTVEGLHCKRLIQCLPSSHRPASVYPPPPVGAGGGPTDWVEYREILDIF